MIEDESQDSLRVDINTADVEELDELPEVGPSTAESIIQYRQTNAAPWTSSRDPGNWARDPGEDSTLCYCLERRGDPDLTWISARP